MPEKYETYEFLSSWLRTLPPADLSFAINDLCRRYSVDLAALSRDASMDWDDLAKLAADPLVTIGSATVNYPALSNLKDSRRATRNDDGQGGRARRRSTAPSGISPIRSAIANPGAAQHVMMAQEAGFASAVSTIPGIVEAAGIHQSACAAAHRLGRTAALAAHDARDAVRVHLSAGQAEPGELGYEALSSEAWTRT